jgi:hypothetical protein
MTIGIPIIALGSFPETTLTLSSDNPPGPDGCPASRSVINRFLRDVRDASVHVVPLEPKTKQNGASRSTAE